MNALDAVDDRDQQTEQDEDQQDLVEAPPGGRVGLENNDMQPLAAAERGVHGAFRVRDRLSLGAMSGVVQAVSQPIKKVSAVRVGVSR